jgi:hypothetical protein
MAALFMAGGAAAVPASRRLLFRREAEEEAATVVVAATAAVADAAPQDSSSAVVDAPLWRDCSADASRIFAYNVSVEQPLLRAGAALNISIEAWLSETVVVDAPLVLSVTQVARDGFVYPISAYFDRGLCGEHTFRMDKYHFYAVGLDCPAAPGIHHWTLLAMIPPEAPPGTYTTSIKLGSSPQLCVETSAITLHPQLR